MMDCEEMQFFFLFCVWLLSLIWHGLSTQDFKKNKNNNKKKSQKLK